jgi:hypothetical protein
VVDPFYAATEPARSAFEAILNAALVGRGVSPEVDSLAMSEIASQPQFSGGWGPTPVEYAYSMGALKRANAVDCSRAVLRITANDPAPIFAHAVLARSVLENAASAYWLLERDIGVEERIRRVLNERLYSERQKIESGILKDDELERARATIESILSEAQSRGWASSGRDRNRYLGAEGRPGFRALVKRVLQSAELGAAFYSFYSAITHGTQYGLAQSFDRDAVDRVRMIAPLKVGPVDVIQAVGACIIAMSTSLEAERALKGWDWPDWNTATRRGLGVIGQPADRTGGATTTRRSVSDYASRVRDEAEWS